VKGPGPTHQLFIELANVKGAIPNGSEAVTSKKVPWHQTPSTQRCEVLVPLPDRLKTPAPSVPRTLHRIDCTQVVVGASNAIPILFISISAFHLAHDQFNSMQSVPERERYGRAMSPFMLKMGTLDFCGVKTALTGPIWEVNGGSPNANTENSYPPGPLGAPDVAPKVAREVELV
jgi:hypothetical protein